jgi:acylphosphatase
LATSNQVGSGRLTIRGWVSGRVQGVGFRWFVLQTARRLGLAGEVANLRDGRVAFLAQGPEPAVRRFVEALRGGPSGARVDALTSENVPDEPPREGFIIR